MNKSDHPKKLTDLFGNKYKSDRPASEGKCECPEPSPWGHTYPPATDPAESEGKNLTAKIHLSDEDAKLLEDFRNAVQKPAAPVDATEDAKAWGMLAEFEMSGSYWRDRDTVRFAIEYAASIDRWIPIRTVDDLPKEDGYYLATVGSFGIDPSDTTCHELNWFKGKWYLPSDEMVEMEPVIAWMHKPEPFVGVTPTAEQGAV